MKKSTVQNKLAELLGLHEFKVDPKTGKTAKEIKNYNAPVGISEDEIQEFRYVQGVMYFLQAPELFTAKTCPHCGENFLVSRHLVAFCSYTCIAKDFESRYGITWSKGKDLEALANDPRVYEGNEPIWIRNIDRLRTVLDSVQESLLLQARMPLTEQSSEPPPTSSPVPQMT